MDADTSASLLAAVRNTRDDSTWVRFHSLYTPLLRVWAERVGLGTHDAEDAVQETLVVVAARLPAFRYDEAFALGLLDDAADETVAAYLAGCPA